MSNFKIISLKELFRELDKHNFNEHHVHHTWKPNRSDFNGNNAIRLQENMANYHIKTLGWSDIGQHISVMPDGSIVTGRDFSTSPASITGENYKAFAMEIVGNFDKGNDKLEGKQLETVIEIGKYFYNKGKYIRFHRENSSKTCPGSGISKDWYMTQVKGKSYISVGDKGAEVKQLQEDLIKLGYSFGKYGADGIFGMSTKSVVLAFQLDNNLSVDGIVGENTLNKIKELLSKPSKSNKSEYMEIGNAKIIKTTPDNIEIKFIANTLHQANLYGVNGSFYNRKEYDLPRAAWSIATNEGKPIGGNSMLVSYNRDIKKGTIIYYEDGSLGIAKVNSINEFWKPHVWSISGYTVLPYMDFKGEHMPPGINYKTTHTYLGFDKGNNIYLIVKPNHLIQEIVPLLKELKIEKCIVLDGGGSSQLNHPGGNYIKSRKVNNAVILKEI